MDCLGGCSRRLYREGRWRLDDDTGFGYLDEPGERHDLALVRYSAYLRDQDEVEKTSAEKKVEADLRVEDERRKREVREAKELKDAEDLSVKIEFNKLFQNQP